MTRIMSAVLGIGLLAVQAGAGIASAAEVRVLCSSGIKAVVEELAPQFETATKHKLSVTYDLAANLKRQIEAGEPFDVAILTPSATDDLIKQRKIAADSRTTLARTGLAIFIRAGGHRSDIGTVDAFKRALLGSKSITYAKEGASGVAFASIIEKLGIAADLKSKTVLAASGEAVGQSVASGQVEFGILPVSEILPVHGVEILAQFPAEIQSYIVMVGGVSAAARQAAAAKDFIAFVTAPAALPVITKKGMERTQ